MLAACASEPEQPHSLDPSQAELNDKPASASSEHRHHPRLLSLLAEELGCKPEDIVDFDLNVVDTQPGVIAGTWKKDVTEVGFCVCVLGGEQEGGARREPRRGEGRGQGGGQGEGSRGGGTRGRGEKRRIRVRAPMCHVPGCHTTACTLLSTRPPLI